MLLRARCMAQVVLRVLLRPCQCQTSVAYFGHGGVYFSRAWVPYFWVPFAAVASQSGLQLPAGSSVDFSRA
jgi:hypothetical protein